MSLIDALAAHGIRSRSFQPGSSKLPCPKCSHTRKNKTDPCLSVTIDDKGAVWQCHHCGWTGAANDRPEPIKQARRRDPVKVTHAAGALPQLVTEWFESRAIPAAVLARNRIGYDSAASAITFPYLRGGEPVNIKFRAHPKKFWQVAGAEKIYCGLDDIAGATEVIICEGEVDKLSLEVAGCLNAISVPDGAPAAVKEIIPEEDRKFEYVGNCADAFKDVTKIILATDGDGPGEILAEELARRYGKHRCWRVTWPTVGDVFHKDANEVLMHLGANVLREVIEHATPYPIKSLHEAGRFESDVVRLFRGESEPSFSTGWPSVDALYRVRRGELTVATGTPGSGKSQFFDALAVNLAEHHTWKFAVCSFENPVKRHLANLAELRTGKPFWPGPTERLSESELRNAMAWINDRFYFIRAEDEAPTIDWILETATSAVLRHGIDGLIIDPYNEIEHKRPANQTETEYISQLLGKVKRFAQAHGVHVWFIAHPAKPQRYQGVQSEPTLYDISGSANWVNKADIGIVIARDYESTKVEIQVKKVRFKEIGKVGSATLLFDRVTGQYRDSSGGGYGQRYAEGGER